MNGLLLIDKPVGISSFDIIRQLRRKFAGGDPSTRSALSGRNAHRALRIGHAGTLDPAASGLMLMLFGAACKKADQFSKLDKTYVAELTLGATSTTGDREGLIRKTANVKRPTLDEIRSTLDGFVGQITQTPSIYSAIKINGQEAYKLARKGQTPQMPSRQVIIHSIELLSYEYPKLTIEVSCSSGTYIRTLAEDIGAKLGTGAYLSALRRTKVGEYAISNAISLDSDSDVIRQTLIIL